MRNLTFIDKFLEAVRDPATFLPSAVPLAERRKLGERVRAQVQSSRRVHFDYDATVAASKLGVLHPELLLQILKRSRPGYQRMVLWWPLRAQFEGADALDHFSEDSPEEVGVLIECQNTAATQYQITPIAMEGGTTFVSPLTIFVDLNDPERVPVSNDETRLLCDATGNSRLTLRVTLLGRAYTGSLAALTKAIHDPDDLIGDTTDAERFRHRADICNQVSRHAAWGFSRYDLFTRDALMGGEIHTMPDLDREARQRFRGYAQEFLTQVVSEHNGRFRMVISMLALLNAGEYVQETAERGGGQRLVRGKLVPYLSHNTVRIRLPREIVVRKMIRRLGEGLPRKRHDVIGHYCNSHKTGLPTCVHHPLIGCQDAVYTAETENLEVCQVPGCGHRRWWREDHARGDAGIGIVTKDYEVERRPR